MDTELLHYDSDLTSKKIINLHEENIFWPQSSSVSLLSILCGLHTKLFTNVIFILTYKNFKSGPYVLHTCEKYVASEE